MTSRNTFPLSLEIRPANRADADRLPELLGNCRSLDIDFRFTVDRSSGSALIYAVSETDLKIIVGRLMDELSARPHIGAPDVRNHEVLKREAEIEYRHKRTRAGVDEFAVVQLRLLRADPDLPLSFVSACASDLAPLDVHDAIARGVASVGESGPIVGKPVYGALATLVGLKAIEGISMPLHFEIAARAATREGLRRNCQLYEPIMAVDVSTPDDFVGSIIADLISRRGSVLRHHTVQALLIVEAEVPLGNLMGYMNSLRSMTEGLGTYTQRFSHYAPVPGDGPDDFAPAVALRG